MVATSKSDKSHSD